MINNWKTNGRFYRYITTVIILPLVIFLVISIIKRVSNRDEINKIIYVESIGNDAASIQIALDRVGENGTVILEYGRIYTQENSIVIRHDGIKILGNKATLKRADQQFTRTLEDCDSSSNSIKVASVLNWNPGDNIQIYIDSTFLTSNVVTGTFIQSITDGNVTFMGKVGENAGKAPAHWPKGSYARKVYAQILGDEGLSFTLEDIIFDGNMNGNNGNYYWGVNPTINAYGQILVNRCQFKNIPNENLIGVGFNVSRCYAKKLNGSFIHNSGRNDYKDATSYYSFISNTITDSTNILSSIEITGHSEGLITFSSTAGRQIIHNNYFFNGGNSVLGNIAALEGKAGGTRDFIFTDNYVSGFSAIINKFFNTGMENIAGNFSIANNIFDNCGINDYFTVDLNGYDEINISGNLLWGNTKWFNIPTEAQVSQNIQLEKVVLKRKNNSHPDELSESGLIYFDTKNFREVDKQVINNNMSIKAHGQKNYWGLPRLSIHGAKNWKDIDVELLSIDANTNSIITPFDMAIIDTTKGLVLNSPDGKKWRVRINNEGILKSSLVVE